MQLYFIRHGQSANNALWDRTGSSKGRSEDPDLTETGLKQAMQLGEFIKKADAGTAPARQDGQNTSGFHLTHLYCSLMRRAVQTGWAVSQAVNLPLTGWIDIHEEGGIYQDDEKTGKTIARPGISRSELLQLFPSMVLPDHITDQGWWNREREPYEELILRVKRFLQDLDEIHGGSEDRVAVVSHGAFYNALMRELLQMPEGDLNIWFYINNTAMTRVDFYNNGMGVVYMNRTEHLPVALIT